MPVGKLVAQAGHAYDYTLSLAEKIDPERAQRYKTHETRGSKVALSAKNQRQLVRAYEKLKELGVTCALVADSSHILPPHFLGQPIITALGVGPCTQKECREVTKKFQCL